MRCDHARLFLLSGALLVAAGCASGHLFFSARNGEGVAPRVKRTDITLARDEGSWGKPIAVSQEQILER